MRDLKAPGSVAPGVIVSGEAPPTRTWLVLGVLLLGVTLTAVDTTIVVLALPTMIDALRSDLISMVWAIMGYLLVLTVLATQVGRLGDMFGRVRMYEAGLAVFVLGSMLCGFAASGPELIGFRVVQAAGGALITANSGAIVADSVAFDRRGQAYGLIGIGWSAGAILGILLGGVLITFVGWRWIFFINLPIGGLAVALAARVLAEHAPRQRQRLDLLGMMTLGGALGLVIWSLTDLAGGGWDAGVAVKMAFGFSLLIAFVAWERVCSSPLLRLSLLRSRVLTASLFAAFFQGLGGFAVLFLLIMYLQGVRSLSPLDASMVLVPGYLLGGFVAPFAGRLADRYGARVPASAGLALQAVGILVYASLGLGTPLWIVVAGSLISGVGNSSFFPANSSAVMANAPANSYGVASGLLRMFQNIGQVASFAVALTIAAAVVPRPVAFQIFVGVRRLTPSLSASFVHGLHAALFTSIGLIGIACVLSLLRGRGVQGVSGRAQTREPWPRPAEQTGARPG